MPAMIDPPANSTSIKDSPEARNMRGVVAAAPTPAPAAAVAAPAFPLPCVKIYSKDRTHGPDPLVPWIAVVTGEGIASVTGRSVPIVHATAFVPQEQQQYNGGHPMKAFKDIPVVKDWTPIKPTDSAWPFPMFAVPCK